MLFSVPAFCGVSLIPASFLIKDGFFLHHGALSGGELDRRKGWRQHSVMVGFCFQFFRQELQYPTGHQQLVGGLYKNGGILLCKGLCTPRILLILACVKESVTFGIVSDWLWYSGGFYPALVFLPYNIYCSWLSSSRTVKGLLIHQGPAFSPVLLFRFSPCCFHE